MRPQRQVTVYALLDRGLSQPQVAAQTGIPFATVKMWSAKRGRLAA
jgi:DNA-binding NarL/FixJ family response regulator